ncbi:MAG: glycosyltransferase, partial [Planctomycetota bacterium]
MKLSIIIPAFNEEKEIGPCLESVSQACADHPDSPEIIVVDNNSDDATATIARDSGASVVYEPINQISRARNRGARRATGEWLLFIDADSRLARESYADLRESL